MKTNLQRMVSFDISSPTVEFCILYRHDNFIATSQIVNNLKIAVGTAIASLCCEEGPKT